MTTSSLPTIESWVPAAVANAAVRLHAKFTEQNSEDGLTALSRLISDGRMQTVWQTLYSKKRDDKYQSTELFVYPAMVTFKSMAANHRRQACDLRKKGGESNESEADLLDAQAKVEESLPDFPSYSALHEQDYAVARVFDYACRAAIDISPTYLLDIEARLAKVKAVSAVLREQTTELVKLGLFDEAGILGNIIDQVDGMAALDQESIDDCNPIIISRRRGDPKLRTYVVALYKLVFPMFGTPLYGTLATIANVVFDRKTVTRQMVQDWLP